MEKRCKFWLPKKKRFCANLPLNDSLFCGNHNPRSEGQWILCPIDPSHSVLQENLESHVKRCPLLKQVQSLALQPFYQKGINSGPQEEDTLSSEMKRNAVYTMTAPQFAALISNIQSIHAAICVDVRDSYQIPEACGMWIKREIDKKLPFQEKHVVQQASILGNLEEIGVLKSCISNAKGSELGEEPKCEDMLYGDDSNVSAVVEFGAGRGYLTQMLADCYGINKVFLVERKSYKLKADRSLRQKESLILERLRIDIEDLSLNAIESLHGVPFLAIGKHLCGPATDLTLRCCIREQSNQENIVRIGDKPCLRGLAIATCCHHLCQWKHYINKKYFLNLGITKDDFHAITWFTSWAVDADHGSDLPDASDCRVCLQSIEKKKKEPGEEETGVEEIVRNMKAVERAVLGFMCKEIIDMGRFMWVKECQLETQFVKYVPSSISPENHLLIARCGKPLAKP